MASYSCLNRILMSIESVVLEPAMNLDIQIHDKHLKAVSKDLLNFRNGNILSLNDSSSELKRLSAILPVSGLEGYSSHFRSLTKGVGTFSYYFHGFAPKNSSL